MRLRQGCAGENMGCRRTREGADSRVGHGKPHQEGQEGQQWTGKERANAGQRLRRGQPGQPVLLLLDAKVTAVNRHQVGGLPQPRRAVCKTRDGAHQGQTPLSSPRSWGPPAPP